MTRKGLRKAPGMNIRLERGKVFWPLKHQMHDVHDETDAIKVGTPEWYANRKHCMMGQPRKDRPVFKNGKKKKITHMSVENDTNQQVEVWWKPLHASPEFPENGILAKGETTDPKGFKGGALVKVCVRYQIDVKVGVDMHKDFKVKCLQSSAPQLHGNEKTHLVSAILRLGKRPSWSEWGRKQEDLNRLEYQERAAIRAVPVDSIEYKERVAIRDARVNTRPENRTLLSWLKTEIQPRMQPEAFAVGPQGKHADYVSPGCLLLVLFALTFHWVGIRRIQCYHTLELRLHKPLMEIS
eukprot:gnl/MRDRNA2_/MRDRNA2_125407_c0_seq1.p1 gnl/MRDRNA2_/MRDRNA2_125407_c0~~gnl/MRDRNA2_/MRDRNA2_125407_c0_seq1.p1  ORF type:complete len:296 (+),score=23.08 gnl/MRDRNA2_/MRDRNA2_125407_c0_seq1:80-967(+)